MVYILFLKDDIAVAKSCRKSLDNIDLGVYDGYVEVTREEFDNIELPSKKVDNEWVKSDTFPSIEYPKVEPIEKPTSDAERLRADIDFLALMTGVDL